jgi:tetratricopeptide (TPR) repeat protein
MKRFVTLACIAAIALVFAGRVSAQNEDVREATGLPIQIGTPVIFGHVKLRGLAPGDPKPSIYVVLYFGGVQADRVRTNDRGYYYFLRSASDNASLVFEVDNMEAGRVVLNSSVGNTVRRDIEVDWRAAKQAAQAPPGVISARSAYARDADADKAFDKALDAAANKRSAEAVTIFDQITAKDPKDFVAWAALGSVYFGDSKFQEAEAAYNKALALKPDFMTALINLGKVHLAQKQFDKAITVFTKAASADRTSANAFHFLGEAYLQAKQGSKAVIALNEALRLAPVEKADLHLRLAALYNAAGVKDRAANEYKLFLAQKPDSPDREQMLKYIKENGK